MTKGNLYDVPVGMEKGEWEWELRAEFRSVEAVLPYLVLSYSGSNVVKRCYK